MWQSFSTGRFPFRGALRGILPAHFCVRVRRAIPPQHEPAEHAAWSAPHRSDLVDGGFPVSIVAKKPTRPWIVVLQILGYFVLIPGLVFELIKLLTGF